MNKKNRNFIFLPILIGLVFIISNGCKKEESKSKEDPLITWSNPIDIYFGTLINPIQLNAYSYVPGKFDYNPPLGTKLNVGANQDLTTVFTPADTINYNVISKTVKINVITPSPITDADGNIYNTIRIGTQAWMAENLKTTRYADSTPITFEPDVDEFVSSDMAAYCWYKNDSIVNKAAYGALYSWYAVNTNKLCPTGWHVPSDDEWEAMESYLIDNGYNFDNTKFECKIAKALASDTGWAAFTAVGSVGNTDYHYMRNATGFSALPGGLRDGSGDVNIRGVACWWTSSESSENVATYRKISCVDYGLYSLGMGKRVGYSVRCIKD